MGILIVTPLKMELELLTRSLRSRGFSDVSVAIGRLSVCLFPELQVGLAYGGHGKAQCALQTQHLLDCGTQMDLVICAGATGALSDGLCVGDIVVAETTIEHDYRLKFVNRPAPQFPGASAIILSLRRNPIPLTAFQVHYGIIASGDEDVITSERGQELRTQTGAIAVAWEGAGVARACAFSGTPFLEIRAVTDTADHNAPADFETNLGMAMKNLGTFIVYISTTIIAKKR